METTITHGYMIKFVDNSITEVGHKFLEHNTELVELVMDNLTRVRDRCFFSNENI